MALNVMSNNAASCCCVPNVIRLLFSYCDVFIPSVVVYRCRIPLVLVSIGYQ